MGAARHRPGFKIRPKDCRIRRIYGLRRAVLSFFLRRENHVIRAPATRTNSIQEMHIVIGHMLCGFIEEALC